MVTTTSLGWLARRDGTEGTISGDEIPGGLDNIFQRLSARKLDDFEATTYANTAALRLEWSVGGGSANVALSSSGNAISGDASLEVIADGSTDSVYRTFLHSKFGRVYPGGSKPSWSTEANSGSSIKTLIFINPDSSSKTYKLSSNLVIASCSAI